MTSNFNSSTVLNGLCVVFAALVGAFLLDAWGKPRPVAQIPLVDPQFTNIATVRMSAADLIATDGDTSGLACYACHEENKRVELHRDAAGKIVLPEDHEDIKFEHGRNRRNDNCFNCHNPAKLDTLITRDGTVLEMTESSQLCGSCHGPTYRDWELGAHGRREGYWMTRMGEMRRKDCASCHDPHSPAFPELKPAPAPRGRYDGGPGAANHNTPENEEH